MAKLIDLIVSGKSSFANDINAKTIYSTRLYMSGAISTCSTEGSWVSGMTNAAIRYNDNAALTTGSYYPFLSMKAAGGHVVNFGGLNNNIGFYGFYNGRTANDYDWRFTVNSATGQWSMSESITSSAFITSGGTNTQIVRGDGTLQTISSLSVNYANSAGSVAWGNVTGKPSTFPVATHNHDDKYVKLNGTSVMTGDLTLSLGDVDRFIVFSYNDTTNPASNSWRTGVLGSGSGEANYYVVQYQRVNTGSSNWSTAFKIGQDTGNVTFTNNIAIGDKVNYYAGNLTPKTITLSTSAQTYITANGTNYTLKLPNSDPYTSARTPTAHTHYATTFKDSRNEAMTPAQGANVNGIAIDFKTKANGVGAGSGSYCGLVTFDPYADVSGGYPMQMGFNSGPDTNNTNEVYIRTAKDSTTWNTWRTIINDANYTSYTVKKDGTGATGTWGINISGSAGSVAWANITGKPTSFAPASHNHDTVYLPRLRMRNPSNGTSAQGGIPFPISLKGAGYPLYDDPEFASGNNDVNVYNNAGNGTVEIRRIVDNQESSNSSGYILQIYTSTGTAAPGRGGFCLAIPSRTNAVFAQIFRAKIPTGFSVNNAENSMGNGYSTHWLTDTAGTGKWEWYIRITICGTGGTFHDGGYVYLKGSGEVMWYLSYCNVIDLTKGNYDGLKTKYSENADFAEQAGNADNAFNADWANNADTVDGKHADKFPWIYNSYNILNSTSVTCNDIAANTSSNAQMGMIKASTNNPTGSSKWVHVWSQTWNKGVISSWVSQIALGVQDGNGMWYRTTSGDLASKNWTRVIDSNNIGLQSVRYASSSPAAANFGISSSTKYIKININPATAWMLSFVVSIHQYDPSFGFKSFKVMISGYNNGNWSSPQAMIIGESFDSDPFIVPVYFGYESSYNLWVAFDGGHNVGVSISDITNGYVPMPLNNLFTIVAVDSLSGVIQTTVNALMIAHYAASADRLSTSAGSRTNPIYFNANGKPAACTYSLNATVNSGTAGNLAYYSGANEISSYNTTLGGNGRPVYLSNGKLTVSSIGIIWCGYVYRNGYNNTSWSTSYQFNSSMTTSSGANTSISASVSMNTKTGLMTISLSAPNMTVSAYAAFASTRTIYSGSTYYPNTGQVSGRSAGLGDYWTYCSGSTVYIKKFKQQNGDNDSWADTDLNTTTTGNGNKPILSFNLLIIGNIY